MATASEVRFKSYKIKNAVQNVDQQLKRYLTACDREDASYRIVENAIAQKLIPAVENMMVEDAMEGGSHPMKHHIYQGQSALFCSHSCYVANYGFAKGLLINELKKIGDIPFYDAGNMIDEGNRLLNMIDDLDKGMGYSDFNQKYYRVPKLTGTDKLLSNIERMIDAAIKVGFSDKLLDAMPYYNTTTGECGFYLDMLPDKKISDYALFQFLSQNRQALGVGIPVLKNDTLYLGSPVKRYNLHMQFTLTNPQKNKEEFQMLYAKFELVTRDIHSDNLLEQGFIASIADINLSAIDTRAFSTHLLNDKVFKQNFDVIGKEPIGKYFNDEYEGGLKRIAAKANQSKTER